MITVSPRPKAPSADARWKLVEATMRRFGYQPSALIETLHTVQESFGYWDPVSLRFIAESLRVPFSRAYGVATFYNIFSTRPPGEHTCVVCMGTACYIKGSQDLCDRIQKTLGVAPGETTADKKVSFLTARCLGSCGRAPAAVLDGEMHGKLSPDMTEQILRKWTQR